VERGDGGGEGEREREREICEHSEMVKEAFSVPPNNNIVLHLGFE
jgi:hypothetical protein